MKQKSLAGRYAAINMIRNSSQWFFPPDVHILYNLFPLSAGETVTCFEPLEYGKGDEMYVMVCTWLYTKILVFILLEVPLSLSHTLLALNRKLLCAESPMLRGSDARNWKWPLGTEGNPGN